MKLSIGTKSILYGAHCFFLHPWFVALAWWQLYGFPWDPRLWVAFFVHDLGYRGMPNMDGPEGERHVLFGADLMGRLFDWYDCRPFTGRPRTWFNFCMYHSRYWAKKHAVDFNPGAVPSRLCYADKWAFVITPAWLYMLCVWLTGEWREYASAHNHEVHHDATTLRGWYYPSRAYVADWVGEHIHGKPDTWTKEKPAHVAQD